MDKTKEVTKDDILEILAENLENHIIYLMDRSGQKVNKEQAKGMLTNVGVFLLKKALSKPIINSK